MKDDVDWGKLFAALRQAKGDLEEAKIKESCARSVSTNALNEVNRAQNAINKAIQDEKKNAPISTDWHRELNPPRSVA